MEDYVTELGTTPATLSQMRAMVNRVCVFVRRGSAQIVVATGSAESMHDVEFCDGIEELLPTLRGLRLVPAVPFDAHGDYPALEPLRAGSFGTFVTDAESIERRRASEALRDFVESRLGDLT